MGEQREKREERRLRRRCPGCGGRNLIRGCRVPGVQLQMLHEGKGATSGPIALYSDVCLDCGLTSFYARRGEVANEMKQIGADPAAEEGGEGTE